VLNIYLSEVIIMLKNRFSKLLKIDSLVTLALTGVFCYLAVSGVIAAEVFMPVFIVVINYYFDYKRHKKDEQDSAPI
jgi:hypothetical protein